MSVTLEPQHIEVLKTFVDLCIKTPTILQQPELSFIREFIERFGGKLSKAKTDESPCKKPKSANVLKESKPEPKPHQKPIQKTESKEEVEAETESEAVAESEETNLRVNINEVIGTNALQKMGNLTLQPTEEEIAESEAKCSEAASAFAEEDIEKAIELYTEAIVLNPQAALLYAKRGQMYLISYMPNACIRDCDRALALDPMCKSGHKFKAQALLMHEKIEEAIPHIKIAYDHDDLDLDDRKDEYIPPAYLHNTYFFPSS
ncbi:Hsc70-interacting protein 2 [Habropoda laboriosa]|uniref:Hsc70-interacting protein 2 n=1 Tax=Habropoda laboriosa TaxID=597456 RepID=A0A0L7R5J9_9HYME|nr:PREDICTED: putative protein FAM10A4 [Habropoda laboriosa]KOC66160.1 Hsc70-interacting protein 2 [Habropoda laboriosa]